MIHEPKPLIEEHWHIQDLIKAQEKRARDRQYHRTQAKMKAERDEEIEKAKGFEVKPFWCRSCRKDFVSEAVKQVEVDWTNPDQNIAFYRTKCFCGEWCMRLITDPLSDSYWQLSKTVARDRGKYSIDLLQPFENNYNLVYGKK